MFCDESVCVRGGPTNPLRCGPVGVSDPLSRSGRTRRPPFEATPRVRSAEVSSRIFRFRSHGCHRWTAHRVGSTDERERKRGGGTGVRTEDPNGGCIYWTLVQE